MFIVGQKKLLKDIDYLADTDKFPRFSIIVGITGSGRKVISSYIAKKLNATFVPCDISVDGVREVIDLCYTIESPVVYMFADADNMSINAKNAILKVVEEPPQNAYFIMTTETSQGLLDTLFSRGHKFDIQPYTTDDIKEYANHKIENISNTQLKYITSIAKTPLDVVALSKINVSQMFKVIDVLTKSITTANLANILKISTFLKYKADDSDTEKFDATLFVRSYMYELLQCMKESPNTLYKDLISITSAYLVDLNNKALSKQITVDNWLLDLHLKAMEVVDS